jgi:predicted nucleic acid-binding protein
MRLLFDTNVVLDVLLDRRRFAEASARSWAAVETGVAEGLLAAHAVTTIHYLVRKELGNSQAARIISSLLGVFGVAAVNQEVLEEALRSPSPDFEDAVTAAAARCAGCDCIVTRDPKGFRGSTVRALTPEAVMPILSAGR